MKAIGVIFLAALLALAAPALAEMQKVSLQGRDYILYEPDGAAPAPLPLVIALHGASGSAAGMANHLPLFTSMKDRQFRLAFLNGSKFEKVAGELDRGWNDGSCCSVSPQPQADDSGFILAVITSLIDKGLAQPGEVYLVGHSNGAKMAYRFVCDHGGAIAAMVAISGARDMPTCPGITGLRVLNIHGSNDETYPVDGGYSDENPDLMRDPIATAGASLQRNGAAFHLVTVPDAGHRLPSLDRLLERATGQGLPDTILDFIFSDVIPDI